MTRRELLATAASGLAAPYFLAGSALGKGTGAPASERVGVGHIGIGGMGGSHLHHFARHPAFPSVAVCDVDSNHRDRAAKRVGDRCKTYKDFRRLLDDRDVDAVVIATPDHWHAVIAVRAAEAGKDIYCEKPLSLTIREARAMVDAVRRHGRVFQTGSQQRSASPWPQFYHACSCVRAGRIGKVHTVHVGVGGASRECYLPAEPTPPGLDWDFWLGPAPVRPYHSQLHPFRWRAYRDYSGGSFTDIGAHFFDIAQWGLGTDHTGPVEVYPPDGKEHKRITFKYANGVTMYHGGANGTKFVGSDGLIEVNRRFVRSEPEDIVKEPLLAHERLRTYSPEHHTDWEACIRTRRKPICDVEIGCRSITVCHLGNMAYWLKRPLRWDPAKEEILGDEEASRWLDRHRRAPWHL